MGRGRVAVNQTIGGGGWQEAKGQMLGGLKERG